MSHPHPPSWHRRKTLLQMEISLLLWLSPVCVLSRFSCVWLCNPMDHSPPDSSVYGVLQARILEWVTMSSSRGPSWPRYWTQVSSVSCIGMRVLYHYFHLGNPSVSYKRVTKVTSIWFSESLSYLLILSFLFYWRKFLFFHLFLLVGG